MLRGKHNGKSRSASLGDGRKCANGNRRRCLTRLFAQINLNADIVKQEAGDELLAALDAFLLGKEFGPESQSLQGTKSTIEVLFESS
jgi:hypothetical protein